MLTEILNDSTKLIFVALSSLMFIETAISLIFFLISKKFVENSRNVKATIKRLEIFGQRTRAHINLIDPMGKSIDTTITVPSNKYKENEEIEVLSHNKNPTNVKFNSFLSLWILPAALFQGVITTAIILAVMVSVGTAKPPF